jgi:glucose-6-phosphate isomerase
MKGPPRSGAPVRNSEDGMLLPQGVTIDATDGSVTPQTGRYLKRLSELAGVFHDTAALRASVAALSDPLVYEVIEYRKEGSDLFFGTTAMEPGKVVDEFYMTRGHFHRRRDMSEVYYTQSGEGILLLQSRDGRIETVDMKPNVCAFIPPDWAHRSVNTGSAKLVFVWSCNVEAGQDYADIARHGMRKLVVERDGGPALVDNPRYSA